MNRITISELLIVNYWEALSKSRFMSILYDNKNQIVRTSLPNSNVYSAGTYNSIQNEFEHLYELKEHYDIYELSEDEYLLRVVTSELLG